MARKHRRRTRKRNKKGGFLGPSMSAKVGEGVQGWKDIGADVKARAEVGAAGMKKAYGDVHHGYKSKTQGVGGVVSDPIPGPLSLLLWNYLSPKEKEGSGLLGLGWFGLGGRRLSQHHLLIKCLLEVNLKEIKQFVI